jgi:hypothetical protein
MTTGLSGPDNPKGNMLENALEFWIVRAGQSKRKHAGKRARVVMGDKVLQTKFVNNVCAQT